MSEREVSWGNEEIEEIPVVKVDEKKASWTKNGKKSSAGSAAAEISIPEWSIDTRGDLPSDGRTAVKKEPASTVAANNSSSAPPQWPEEETNEKQRGRERNLEKGAFSGAVPVGKSPERRNKKSGGKKGKLNDDLSSINLPGVDLSKMPAATTKISFKAAGGNGKAASNGDEEKEAVRRGPVDQEKKIVTQKNTEKQVEEAKPVVEKKVEEAKPVVEKKVEETKKQQPSVNAVKVSNESSRLESDGWANEPEAEAEPVKPIKPIKTEAKAKADADAAAAAAAAENLVEKVSQVKIEDSPVKSSKKKNKKASAAAEEEKVIESPEKTEKPVEKIVETSGAPIQQASQAQAQPIPSIPSTAHLGGHPLQFYASSGSIAAPFYPSGPASPTSATYNPAMMMMMPPMQPNAPMSYMPGMMMPIWVTCPFCYHCYMYPPVVPGSGPAPGVSATPILSHNVNNNGNN